MRFSTICGASSVPIRGWRPDLGEGPAPARRPQAFLLGKAPGLAEEDASSYIGGRFIRAGVAMKFVFFALLVLLIIHVGFWGTLGAILGAVLMMIILFALAIAAVVVGVLMLVAGSAR